MATYRVKVGTHVGRVRPDRAKLHAYLRAGGGPVQRDMERRGTNTIQAWRRDVPTGGQLQQTLRQQPGTRTGPGVTCIAGVQGRTNYLGFYHDGTRPHVILPKQNRRNPHLRFVKNGRVVFSKRVRHPGFRGNPFIDRNLHVALR
ncbi:hypothetical protein [Pseudonocardia sp. NPDC049635]|uniref:hypothetical protein n=1 Tax=Pseudonocardia sp. NPDC049635 TaxID=3155506 RepID=UPI0033F4A221